MNDSAPEWVKDFTHIKDPVEQLEFVRNFLPNWITNVIDNYSDDYNYLIQNWKLICNGMNVSPQKILLVNHLPTNKDDKDFLKINFISDLLTRNGYIIRRNNEFISCRNCLKAIPSESLYNMIREKAPPQISSTTPLYYSDTCSNC